MDLISVLTPFFNFFERYCATVITIGGFSFTIGALFLWCILAVLVINFIRGLAS